MKKHYVVSYENGYGYTTVTLCGRAHSEGDCDTGNNVSETEAEVTCKLCLNILAEPNHWRHRKYLKPSSSSTAKSSSLETQ